MTVWQRFVLWLARRAGLLPDVPAGLVDQARVLVREVEVSHGKESGEYRRHLAFKRLTEGGADRRAAAAAIEVAVQREL